MSANYVRITEGFTRGGNTVKNTTFELLESFKRDKDGLYITVDGAGIAGFRAGRNRVYVELGDIVLISLRDFENEDEAEKREEVGGKKEESNRGDILAKYPYETLSKLKKEDGVNPNLFMSLETLDGARLAAVGGGNANVIVDGDDGFEFDRDGAPAEEGGGQDSDSDEELNIDDI